MRVIITEYKRMFYEKKLVTLLVITLVYIIICSSFRWLRYRLDYPYEELHYQLSAFYLWQMNMEEGFMTMILKIMPPLIYVFSFLDDKKCGIDQQICIRTHGNRYYLIKYITAISGGMLYNFLVVLMMYFSMYFCLSTGSRGFNELDRTDALVGRFFEGNTAMGFVFMIAVSYAFVGGVCCAMSFDISLWVENRVLICLVPYMIFKMMEQFFDRRIRLINILIGEVDVGMSDKPFGFMVLFFAWWVLVLSILFIIGYTVTIERKR